MEKAIITLIGKDSVGIIGKVCTYFAENGMNIIDIAQTTVRGIINMIMIVDVSTTDKGFDAMREDLRKVSADVGCSITLYSEDDLDGFKEVAA